LRMNIPFILVNPSDRPRACLTGEAMHTDFDQGGAAGQAIDQTEQLTQHDPTPLLIMGAHDSPRVFPAVFADQVKWLRSGQL